MGCAEDKITIKPGRNVWLLARTDRDAADLAGVLDTTGAVLKRFLGRASPPGTRSVFEVLQSPKDTPHQARFVIGAARPVLVDAVQASSPEKALSEQPIIPSNVRTDTFTDCPVVRTIAAQRPWFVCVEFDWRGQTTKIDWPRRAVNFLGMPFDTIHGNDWLLVSAGHLGKAKEADTDLLSEVSDETADAIKSAAEGVATTVGPLLFGLGIAGGVAGVAYLVYRFSRPRRTTTEEA